MRSNDIKSCRQIIIYITIKLQNKNLNLKFFIEFFSCLRFHHTAHIIILCLLFFTQYIATLSLPLSPNMNSQSFFNWLGSLSSSSSESTTSSTFTTILHYSLSFGLVFAMNEPLMDEICRIL